MTIQRNIVGRYALNSKLHLTYLDDIIAMASYRSHRLWLLPLIVLLSVFSFASAKRIVRVNNKAGINGAPASFPYLYAIKNNLNASYPVIEYIAPTGAKKLENDRPNFLYDTNQGYRIVEFYGHWCNTCKNFKPHFLNFAQRVKQIASDQNERVDIYAVSCHPNRRLCRKQTSKGYPIVRLFKPGETTGIDLLYSDINPIRALEKMGMNIEAAEYADDWDVPEPKINLYPTWQRIVDEIMGNEREVRQYHHRTREELKADIHLSLDFAFRDGIFTSDSPLTDKAAGALKEWLKLLHRTLPDAWEAHSLIEELLTNFKYISKHEGYLTRILDHHPPDSARWSEACSHGDSDAGYTCGLWELFHAMTVGVVNYNMMAAEHRRISTEEAAITLRNYIENFFGCIDCRNHFLSTFDSCAYNRCTRFEKDVTGIAQMKQKSWVELPLWLFELHNGVNVRLVQEKAKRENRIASASEEAAALWPMKEECLPCYNADLKQKNVTWDFKNTYNWLQLEYGQLDSSSGAIRKEIHDLTVQTQRKLRKKGRRVKLSFGSIFGGLCFLLYSCVKVRRRLVTGRHKKEDN